MPAAVLLVDIDHFKRVNDRYGHLAGDELLAATASTLVSHVRAGDVLGRFGGEEFVVLLPGAEPGAGGLDRRTAPGAGPGHRRPVARRRGHVTVSIGVAALGRDGNELFELLAAADAALYRAKQAGRDRVRHAAAGRMPVRPSAPLPLTLNHA